LAVYGPAIYQDGLIDKSALALFLMTALLAVVILERPLALGLVLGLLALTRENALLLAIPLVLWIGYRTRVALLFLTGVAIVLVPVGLRNLAVGGTFRLTTAQFGPNFYIGNHEGARGSYEALVTGHGSAADEQQDATRLAETALGRRLTPGEVSSYWTGRALDFIRSQPAEWLGLMARKAALVFSASELADTESQEVYAESSGLLRVLGLFDFGVVLGLAVVGAILSAPDWRRLWWIYGIAGVYAASVIGFYVFARYRLPLVPALLLLAVAGLGHRARLIPAAIAGIAIAAVAHVPVEDARAVRAVNYYSIASALAQDPSRASDAAGYYQRALEIDPRMPAAHFGLGTLLARGGRAGDAILQYQAALAAWPDYAEARFNLAAALAGEGRPEDAIREFREYLRLRPDDPEGHAALGKALLAMGRAGDAIAEYRKAVDLGPKNAALLVGFGVALAQGGEAGEAIRQFQAALAIDSVNAAAENSWGATLAGSGRVAEALPHFERAYQLGDQGALRNLEAARSMLRR
jgi:tetratricopeptide (TPR) repeat protein